MPTEDLTTFTEVNGSIAKTADRCTVSSFSRVGSERLYKSYGAGYFTDFTHEFEYYLDSNDVYAWWVIWGVSNDTVQVSNTTGREYVFRVGSKGTSNRNWLYLYEYNNGVSQGSDLLDSNIAMDTVFYIRIIKSGTALSAEIYSDSARTPGGLIDTLSLVVTDESMEYLFVAQALGAGAARLSAGYSQLYDLNAVKTSDSEDLYAKFEVLQGTADLFAKFEVPNQGSVDLKSVFCISQKTIENFGNYTEVDSAGDITRICNRVTWTSMRRDAVSYVYRDFGASYFGDFEFQCTIVMTDVDAGDSDSRVIMSPLGLTSDLGVISGRGGVGESCLIIHLTQNGSTDDQFKFNVYQRQNGNVEMWETGAVRGLGTYYLSVGRTGTTIYLKVYDDAARTNLLENLTDLGLVYDYPYIQVSTSGGYATDPADHSTGYLEDLELFIAENLFAKFEIYSAGTADLFTKFQMGQQTGTADLFAELEVRNAGIADLFAELVVRQEASVDLFAKFEIQDSEDLSAEFRVKCSRRFGGNWQRKMWYTGGYYWRGRYDPVALELKFEYIAETDIESNVWVENTNAAIDASTFTGLLADFTVRGTNAIPSTIHYSDGVDTWIAESDEASALGWAWQNTTKIFDATAPDLYRMVNLAADRKPINPKLWACAVFIDDSEGKQWVQTKQQSSSGDITGWEAAVDVSNVDNTSKIYGSSARSMGVLGPLSNDMMWVYKEGIALRSRYYTGAWQAIQDIDTTTDPGKALWDFEHGEDAGENEGHIIYVDADGSVQWRERDAGGASVWSAAEQLHAGIHIHYGVGIVERGDGWLWTIWADDHVIEYRLHLCETEVWFPVLGDSPLVFDISTEAVINTSTIEQPQTPDSVPAGFPVPMVWIGETTPTTPCAIGWGLLRAKSYEALFAEFTVRQETSVDLFAKFEVGQDSQNLYAKFEAQVSQNLFAEFVVRQETSADLFSYFVVQQTGTVDLFAEFTVRQETSADLFAELTVLQPGTVDLFAEFTVRQETSADLFAELTVRQETSVDLSAEFAVGSLSIDLFAYFEVTHSEELFAKFEAQATQDLFAKFEAQATQDLFGYFEVTHSEELFAKFEIQDSEDLFAYFVVQQTDTADLFAELVTRFTATKNLYAELIIRHSTYPRRKVFCKFVVIRSTSLDLYAEFKVSQTTVTQDLAAEFFLNQYNGLVVLYSRFYVSPDRLTAPSFEIEGASRTKITGITQPGTMQPIVKPARKRRSTWLK